MIQIVTIKNIIKIYLFLSFSAVVCMYEYLYECLNIDCAPSNSFLYIFCGHKIVFYIQTQLPTYDKIWVKQNFLNTRIKIVLNEYVYLSIVMIIVLCLVPDIGEVSFHSSPVVLALAIPVNLGLNHSLKEPQPTDQPRPKFYGELTTRSTLLRGALAQPHGKLLQGKTEKRYGHIINGSTRFCTAFNFDLSKPSMYQILIDY
ncbi:hypothetical protein FF38_05571 [Lucilia cuprina]|uniref:Uncharacterized protein n=1 Tax=Lucilia cuprina TaxID=7375 RepID=A0A0L0CGD3_LUCCU|nr:hypothetical protein FF38_05571 [Lucilia cuprina]